MIKKKVIHLTGHLGIGGAEKLILDYALNIDRKRFEIIIITTGKKRGSLIEEKLCKEGIKVYHLGDLVEFPYTKNIIKRLYNKYIKYKLFNKIIRKESPDIIHSHLYVNRFILFSIINKYNIKLFYTVHSNVERLFGKGKFK